MFKNIALASASLFAFEVYNDGVRAMPSSLAGYAAKLGEKNVDLFELFEELPTLGGADVELDGQINGLLDDVVKLVDLTKEVYNAPASGDTAIVKSFLKKWQELHKAGTTKDPKEALDSSVESIDLIVKLFAKIPGGSQARLQWDEVKSTERLARVFDEAVTPEGAAKWLNTAFVASELVNVSGDVAEQAAARLRDTDQLSADARAVVADSPDGFGRIGLTEEGVTDVEADAAVPSVGSDNVERATPTTRTSLAAYELEDLLGFVRDDISGTFEVKVPINDDGVILLQKSGTSQYYHLSWKTDAEMILVLQEVDFPARTPTTGADPVEITVPRITDSDNPNLGAVLRDVTPSDQAADSLTPAETFTQQFERFKEHLWRPGHSAKWLPLIMHGTGKKLKLESLWEMQSTFQNATIVKKAVGSTHFIERKNLFTTLVLGMLHSHGVGPSGKSFNASQLLLQNGSEATDLSIKQFGYTTDQVLVTDLVKYVSDNSERLTYDGGLRFSTAATIAADEKRNKFIQAFGSMLFEWDEKTKRYTETFRKDIRDLLEYRNLVLRLAAEGAGRSFDNEILTDHLGSGDDSLWHEIESKFSTTAATTLSNQIDAAKFLVRQITGIGTSSSEDIEREMDKIFEYSKQLSASLPRFEYSVSPAQIDDERHHNPLSRSLDAFTDALDTSSYFFKSPMHLDDASQGLFYSRMLFKQLAHDSLAQYKTTIDADLRSQFGIDASGDLDAKLTTLITGAAAEYKGVLKDDVRIDLGYAGDHSTTSADRVHLQVGGADAISTVDALRGVFQGDDFTEANFYDPTKQKALFNAVMEMFKVETGANTSIKTPFQKLKETLTGSSGFKTSSTAANSRYPGFLNLNSGSTHADKATAALIDSIAGAIGTTPTPVSDGATAVYTATTPVSGAGGSYSLVANFFALLNKLLDSTAQKGDRVLAGTSTSEKKQNLIKLMDFLTETPDGETLPRFKAFFASAPLTESSAYSTLINASTVLFGTGSSVNVALANETFVPTYISADDTAQTGFNTLFGGNISATTDFDSRAPRALLYLYGMHKELARGLLVIHALEDQAVSLAHTKYNQAEVLKDSTASDFKFSFKAAYDDFKRHQHGLDVIKGKGFGGQYLAGDMLAASPSVLDDSILGVGELAHTTNGFGGLGGLGGWGATKNLPKVTGLLKYGMSYLARGISDEVTKDTTRYVDIYDVADTSVTPNVAAGINTGRADWALGGHAAFVYKDAEKGTNTVKDIIKEDLYDSLGLAHLMLPKYGTDEHFHNYDFAKYYTQTGVHTTDRTYGVRASQYTLALMRAYVKNTTSGASSTFSFVDDADHVSSHFADANNPLVASDKQFKKVYELARKSYVDRLKAPDVVNAFVEQMIEGVSDSVMDLFSSGGCAGFGTDTAGLNAVVGGVITPVTGTQTASPTTAAGLVKPNSIFTEAGTTNNGWVAGGILKTSVTNPITNPKTDTIKLFVANMLRGRVRIADIGTGGTAVNNIPGRKIALLKPTAGWGTTRDAGGGMKVPDLTATTAGSWVDGHHTGVSQTYFRIAPDVGSIVKA